MGRLRTLLTTPFPCQDSVWLKLDPEGFPIGLVVDSIGYRVVPAARIPLEHQMVQLATWRPEDAGEPHFKRLVSLRWRLLRRALRGRSKDQIRLAAGLLFEQLRRGHFQGQLDQVDSPETYRAVNAEALRLAAAELAAEVGLDLVPLRGRRALDTAAPIAG